MRAKGKGDNGTSAERTTYINKLAGEIITGEPMETYTNANMERGKVMCWKDHRYTQHRFAFV